MTTNNKKFVFTHISHKNGRRPCLILFLVASTVHFNSLIPQLFESPSQGNPPNSLSHLGCVMSSLAFFSLSLALYCIDQCRLSPSSCLLFLGQFLSILIPNSASQVFSYLGWKRLPCEQRRNRKHTLLVLVIPGKVLMIKE